MNVQLEELVTDCFICAKYQDKAATDLRQFVKYPAEPGNN